MSVLTFPKNFFWGAATAGHQVEGNLTDDWTEWEKSTKRLKNLKTKGLIDKFGLDNYISGQACDHYNRYQEDFNLAKKLGHNATRFSIEWSRIEPEKGKFNQKAIDHYKKVVDYLRKINIEPFVTLWHWPIPLWLRDKGGWKNPEVVNYFARYTEKVVSALKNDVKFWITLNEPEMWAGIAYLIGKWPPNQINPISYLAVINNQITAHQHAYVVIKRIDSTLQVGIAKNYAYYEACNNRLVNRLVKICCDWWQNLYFLNKIQAYQDFIGLNHYYYHQLNLLGENDKRMFITYLGWKYYPPSIYYSIKELWARYHKPIYITENGTADALDKIRPWYIVENLKYVHQAISEGANVGGYLHWSLMDNFEWDSGYWPRFGLVEVDRKTLIRTPRPSSYLFRDICKANCVTPAIFDKYSGLILNF